MTEPHPGDPQVSTMQQLERARLHIARGDYCAARAAPRAALSCYRAAWELADKIMETNDERSIFCAALLRH